MKMPWKYRIAIIVAILACVVACVAILVLAGHGLLYIITGHSSPIEAKIQADPAPDTIIGQVERIQKALKATGIPRYDPCEIDNDPGPHFRKAYNNYSYDQFDREICSRMQGERK